VERWRRVRKWQIRAYGKLETETRQIKLVAARARGWCGGIGSNGGWLRSTGGGYSGAKPGHGPPRFLVKERLGLCTRGPAHQLLHGVFKRSSMVEENEATLFISLASLGIEARKTGRSHEVLAAACRHGHGAPPVRRTGQRSNSCWSRAGSCDQTTQAIESSPQTHLQFLA
jgi:hypothetical protein